MKNSILRLAIGWIVPGVLLLSLPGIVGAEDRTMESVNNDPIVAIIDGEPVSSQEFRLVMHRQAAVVFAHFKEHHKIEDRQGYWNEQPGEKTPIAMLREVTLKELAEIKVCQKLAQERGLITNSSFCSFQADFNKENERRRTTAEAGGVVYGPRQYREAAYYYIRHGDLLFRVKGALSKEAEPTITEEMITAYFEAHQGSFGERTETEIKAKIRTILSDRQANEQFQSRVKAARIQVRPPLRSIAPRIDSEV